MRPGLLTADPRLFAEASLIEEVVEIDHQLEQMAGGPGSAVGSGGMASKLAAAKIATWSGVETVIADAGRPGVVAAAVAGRARRGHGVPGPAPAPLGPQAVDRLRPGGLGSPGRRRGSPAALAEGGRSLLPAGVVAAEGDFGPDDAVEIVGPDGKVFAKGLVRLRRRPVGGVARAPDRSAARGPVPPGRPPR